MKRKSKILAVASVAIISFAQFPFTAFAADTPTTYQIWIGSTQVTSENKDDILSDGGSVKFDPEIHLLTFDNPKEIKGSTYDSSWRAVILSKESVTMTGTLDLVKNSNLSQEIAIWCHGTDLILDNFKVSAKSFNCGIVSLMNNIKIQNGCDINVSNISGGSSSYSIGAGNSIEINNSRVTVDNCSLGIVAHYKNVTINGNNTYVKASNIKNGEPIVTKNLILGDDVQLIKDEANGIYTVKSKNYAWTRTYPTNIKFEYNEKYHQGRFTWDRVKNADRYGIAIYYAGMWRTQTQNITTNSYITPKTLKPGATYKVAIAARVNGKWDTTNAIRNAVTITIPADSPDTDGDGFNDKIDIDPTNYDSINGLLYQSPHKIGIGYTDGEIADDLTINDYSSDQMMNIDKLFKYQIDSSEDYLCSDFRGLMDMFAISGEGREIVSDLIDKFINGTGKSINIQTNDGIVSLPCYTSPKLKEKIYKDDQVQEYVKTVKSEFCKQIELNNGDVVQAKRAMQNIIENTGKSNIAFSKDDWGYLFGGMTLSINDLWGSSVNIDSIEVNGNSYNGVLHFQLYDHFGLDQPDVEKIYVNLAGFRAWFVLQHYDAFNGKYKPFINVYDYYVPFEGEF